MSLVLEAERQSFDNPAFRSPSLILVSSGTILNGSKVSRKVRLACHHMSSKALTSFEVPIILKGIQTWEDTLMAIEAGVQGVVLSNHGGRQLDMARSGLEILGEVVGELKKRNLWPAPNGFQLKFC